VADLTVFVDYDNVQAAHASAGAVNLGRMVVSLLPTFVLVRYTAVAVRLYGGWRSNAKLTRLAQRLIPDIRQGSPSVISIQHEGSNISLRLTVELADKPIGATVPLEETLVFDRDLRKFRTKAPPWQHCSNVGSCGFGTFSSVGHASACGESTCSMKLGDLLVRDEQKMVDTLIVADMAQCVHVAKASDVVVVSSDTDMWPGVLLALRAGCSVIHVHTKHGWRTQGHLMRTIANQLGRSYKQMSV
jgi:hypothetical protein